ncbi:hypothetical protein Golob_027670 [Gossypium lobatum]|uniref:Protein kinase domain-containing protein n=1 Tax=Gossypium lobatum TaxID=34289 RepID=A0A7J8NG97_9ROSI|nr:hypothetical protein [Gossypium lobatum]
MIIVHLKCMYMFIYLYFHNLHYQKLDVSADESAYFPLETILLDCGSSALRALSYDGWNWTNDSSHFGASNSESSFAMSRASSEETSVAEVPYMTARLFHSRFTYTFNVTPGSKFIRLHFYPDSYMNLNASKSFLTVTAGNYTLLRHFSAYLNAKHIKSAYFFKEFIVHVENHTLDLTFSPTTNASDGYAFVNGIEIFRCHIVSIIKATIYIFGEAFGVENYDFDASITYPKEAPAYLHLKELHLCENSRNITKINQKVFDIFINNQVIERGIDIIALTYGNDIPLYRDFTVLIPNLTTKHDLWLELHPNLQIKPQYYDAILNGAEIFKVSNIDGNLARLNPSLENESSVDGDEPSFSSSSSKTSTEAILIIIGSLLVLILAISLGVYLVAFLRRRNLEWTKKENTRSSLPYRSFSIDEIKMATDNFNEAKLIDRGAFGLVYKGYTDHGSIAVTINRLIQAIPKEEWHKFDAELRIHHHVRHQNLVQQQSTLSWNQWLEICVGAARCLHYLHSAMAYPIIHGNIKTTNIYLDRNWMPKVSGFMPSRLAFAMSSHSRIRPNISGSSGYLDPEHYGLQNLTEKSDVFSFGVVLLEILSGKQATNPKSDAAKTNHRENLVHRALTCIEKNEVDLLVDRHLKGKIAPASLAKFVEILNKCLADEGAN